MNKSSNGGHSRLTGTTVHPVRHTNFVEKVDGTWRECRQSIRLDASGNDTGEWTKPIST